MTKAETGRSIVRIARQRPNARYTVRTEQPKAAQQPDSRSCEDISKTRFEAVMQAARQSGLLGDKDGRIGGRVSPALVAQAKRQTGIQTDTDLIEFALATIALEDRFAGAFKEARGKIDPDLTLGF